MTEHQSESEGFRDEPAKGPGDGPWSASDLQLDARARQCIARLLGQNDGSALDELGALLGERLDALEPAILDEIGALVPLDLATEWFTWLFAEGRPDHDVAQHPLAHAQRWMTARGRALVNTLSAQPLPWDTGFRGELPQLWLGRLAIDQPDPEGFYVTLVTLHSLPLITRQVMRDRQVYALDAATCATRLHLSSAQVDQHYREGRAAVLSAMDRHLRGGER